MHFNKINKNKEIDSLQSVEVNLLVYFFTWLFNGAFCLKYGTNSIFRQEKLLDNFSGFQRP